MYVIGTTGNFSNRAHGSMQHDGVGSPDAQLAKVSRQLLYRVHSKRRSIGCSFMDTTV
jgi:hypothetical protein